MRRLLEPPPPVTERGRHEPTRHHRPYRDVATPSNAPSASPPLGAGGDGLVRRAELTDAPAISRFLSTSQQSSTHPGRSFAFVRASIQAGDTWLVAIDEGRTVGCASVTRLPWTGVVELRLLAVDEARRNRSLGLDLYRAATRAAAWDPMCGLAVSRPHRQIAPLFCRVDPVLPTVVVGHDGAAGGSAGRHESQLIMANINPERGDPRAALRAGGPTTAILAAVEGFAAATDHDATPPQQRIVAPQATDWWTDELTHLLDPGSRDLPASVSNDRRAVVRDVRRQLRAMDRDGVRHVGATVPVAHVEVVEDLAGFGFRPTAYLPAWYEVDGVRHDCIRVVRADRVGDPLDQGADVARWDMLLAPLTASAVRWSAP